MHAALLIVGTVAVVAWVAEMFWDAAEEDSMAGFIAASATSLLIVVTFAALTVPA